jgi:hypothetical protein
VKVNPSSEIDRKTTSVNPSGTGKLFLPISHAKISTALSPEKVFDFLESFSNVLKSESVDVCIIYTHDLYDLSDKKKDFHDKVKTTNQITQHSAEIRSRIHHKMMTPDRWACKRRLSIPTGDSASDPKKGVWDDCAIFFMSCDELILNAPTFRFAQEGLNALFDSDADYRKLAANDIEKVGKTSVDDGQAGQEMGPNERFLTEETALTKLILDRSVKVDDHYTSPESWHLIAYPGPPPSSLVYALEKLGPQNQNNENSQNFLQALTVDQNHTSSSPSGGFSQSSESFTGGFYDFNTNTLYGYGKRAKN